MSKKTKMSKKEIAICALFLAGALTAGVCCMGYASRGDNGTWFKNGNLSTWHWSDNKIPDSAVDLIAGNVFMSENEINGLSLQAYALSEEEYAENGVSEKAENAVKIKVNFAPANTTDKTIHASLSFKNTESTWASGKTVSDYVTASVNKQEILLTCVEAFGSQIVLRIDTNTPEVFATVSVDYVCRPTSINFDILQVEHRGSSWLPVETTKPKFTHSGVEYLCEGYVSYGVGTIFPNIRIDQYDITFDNQLLINANLVGPCSLNSATSNEIIETVSLNGRIDCCIFRLDRELLFEIIHRSTNFSEAAVLEGLAKQGVNNDYPYLIVDVNYSVLYGDKVISSGAVTKRSSVDFTPLFVNADEITPDKDNVIF